MAKLVTENLDVDKVVGARIRAERLAQGMTQVEVATKLGITFQQVQKYEKGSNRVAVSTLFRLAEIFKVQPTIFFTHVSRAIMDEVA